MRQQRGFTLVELMIVTVVLGLLAAVALAAYGRYIRRGKSVEATNNIAAIYQAEVTYYSASAERTGVPRFLSQPVLTPDNNPGATAYPANVGVWNNDPVWVALGFVLPTRHFYAYDAPSPTVTGIGAWFDARAVGDLDGDEVNSTFSVRGQIGASGEIQRSAVEITQELE